MRWFATLFNVSTPLLFFAHLMQGVGVPATSETVVMPEAQEHEGQGKASGGLITGGA